MSRGGTCIRTTRSSRIMCCIVSAMIWGTTQGCSDSYISLVAWAHAASTCPRPVRPASAAAFQMWSIH